jgi:hypothetical protein
MENLPLYISIVFICTTVLTLLFFYRAAAYSGITFMLLVAWLAAQYLIGRTGFYAQTGAFPPRFMLLVAPPLLFIIGLFTTSKGRRYLDNLDLRMLTLLHIVRIPVELVLFWLFIYKTIPQLMTFEGRNFDILAGLTAPFIFWLGFRKEQKNKKLLLIWNFICLGLVLNIAVNAALSAPFPFQQFGFEQPNIAVLYVPFVWLPCCVVPLVVLSHLASIRQLLKY